jgi:hypothetical protein
LINTSISNCLWSDAEDNKKIHLANWPSICQKKFGCLGLGLLGSWIRRYIQAEDSLWENVVVAKYNTRNPNVLYCQGAHHSVFWKGIMLADEALKVGNKWQVGNGQQIRF